LELAFVKMSGAGNDFIIIDNRDGKIKEASGLAKKICDRHWGVGADGLVLIEPSDKAAYRMNYYNSDGSYGGMCGNAGRSVALLAYRQNIAHQKHEFEALGHIYSASIDSKEVSIRMKDPAKLSLHRNLVVNKKKIEYHSIDTGAPHVIVEIGQFDKKKNLQNFDIYYWGNLLRWHKKFSPKGTNVDFLKRLDNGSVQLRTYERGVESETLACGTGSIAAAIVAHKLWKLNPPVTIIPTSGVALTVDFTVAGKKISDVILKGPTTITFSGKFDA
jgi:diaminopimelate epimerase